MLTIKNRILTNKYQLMSEKKNNTRNRKFKEYLKIIMAESHRSQFNKQENQFTIQTRHQR